MGKYRQEHDKPKLLYFVSEDWYFCSHRAPHARAARDAGYEVVVVCRENTHGGQIRNDGFRLIPLNLKRRSKNPLRELSTIFSLIRIYAREKPDIAQHVAIKPTLYGSLAAWMTGVPRVVNSVAGMGYIFISNDIAARLLRPLIRLGFRWLLNRGNNHVILQNPDDLEMLTEAGILDPDRVTIIPGSGVDIDAFAPSPEPACGPDNPPIALLVSRMLWDKGIGELVAAARLLRDRKTPICIRLAGGPDPENPATINESQLKAWVEEGVVEWLGPRDDIADLLKKSHIAVLPSYREGLPKSLLEAASAGRPIVASDVPGCREIVKDEKNGLLVPVRTSIPLADALERLANDKGLRQKMGRKGRRMVEETFAEGLITAQTVALYDRLIERNDAI